MSFAVATMLEPRRVALVGASGRQGSFGERMVIEALKSSAAAEIIPVNPKYDEILGRRCVSSLDAIDGPVDLVLLGVPDDALETELTRAARRGDRSAVVFGNAYERPVPGKPTLRERLTAIAENAGMAVCGGGCMGFVNVARGVRALGYIEPAEIPHGPVALVTHSGSVFSAMLRTRRRLGYTVAVSSGQELVTSAAAYLDYALGLEETKVIGLVLETMRDTPALRSVLLRVAEEDVRVVALTVGASEKGRSMVVAHSGALAGADAAWEALFDAYDVARVADLEELADTLELFSAGRRTRRDREGAIATVHDSGAERVLVADIASALGVRFAGISRSTRSRLSELLDPGLEPTNPLDVWGRGADTARLFTGCLEILADDPEVDAIALAIDLVPELDGDDSYLRAAVDAHAATDKPFCVLTNMASALDAQAASELRRVGVPVLEGTRSGLVALGHLVAERPPLPPVTEETVFDAGRRERWAGRLAARPTPTDAPATLVGKDALSLLADFEISTVASETVTSAERAAVVAGRLGFPVVVKTAASGVLHKTDLGGVVLGVRTSDAAAAAYTDLAGRFGPEVLVSETAPSGVELALGVVRDAHLGPLVVVAAGGELAEIVSDRAVGLPPIDERRARRLIDRLRVRPVLDGARGRPPANLSEVAEAIVAISMLALELGDDLDELDVNPLVCGEHGAVAVDALVVVRGST